MTYLKKYFQYILATIKQIKHIQLHALDFIIIYSAILVFIYNISNINNKLVVNKDVGFAIKYSYLLADNLIAFVIIAILLFIFSIHRFVLKFFSLLFLLVSGIFFYFIVSYSLVIDEFLIAAILEEAIADAPDDMITFSSIVAVIIFGVVPFLYTLLYIHITPISFSKAYFKLYTIKLSKYLLLLGALLSISYIIKPLNFTNDRVLKTSMSSFMPFNYMAGTYLYYFDLKADYETIMEDITESNKFIYNADKFNNQPIKVILIIGESARADRQSLNGYPLETNPNLSKIKDLINYSNVQSCGTNSRYSVNCLLSKDGRGTFKFPYLQSNLFSVFNSMGFYTSFLSTQTLYEKASDDGATNLINVAVKDAKEKISVNTIRSQTPYESWIYDEYLIPFMEKIFAKHTQNNFMVLYLSGSHVPYHNKAPPPFQKFTCADYGNCNNDATKRLAEYDNSILYTDYVLAKIINTFADGNTFIYYVSDHAENLGENGIYAHGHVWDEINNPYLIQVPQFIWLSPNMQKILGQDFINMQNKKDEKLNQDYVFHSILDCIGITSNLIDKSLSLCK